MSWRQWFKRWGEYVVRARYYECESDFTIEELYQEFKARLEAERAEKSEEQQL